MSLIRQVRLLLLATLLLALAASVGLVVGSVRDTLQTQLRLKNSDNATALALVLSQQHGQRELMELAAAAQFDTGYYRRIRYTGADGRVVFQREAAPAPLHAPAWFVASLPIDSVPGVAQVSDGWRALGAIEVVSHAAYAYDELWQGSLRAVLALAAVGVAAALIAAAGVARIRRPLDAAVEQASALQRGEYLTQPEPAVPELRRLTQAMNSMVQRLRVAFEAQARQVETLRRQASGDPLTGLANRAHFLARLGAALQAEDGTVAGALVLLRVLELAELNRRLGREAADAMIAAFARELQAAAADVPGAFAGRLNGADFALALPHGGAAEGSARTLLERLRAAEPPLALVAGAAHMHHGAALAELMAAADLALAQAESRGPGSVGAAAAADAAWAGAGELAWHGRVSAALAAGRARLSHYAVVGPQQQLLHLECPLRLQLEPQGGYEIAAHWLPLALRGRLTCEIDERALALALDGIEADGRPRCVNLSPASLEFSGYAARLRDLLQARPQAARSVWLEVHESAAADQFELLRELARQLRPTGARLGLEHAGERLGGIARLFEAELDYVKLDAGVTLGTAADPHRAGFVEGLVTMLHSLQLQVFAEGVCDAADAQTLWACGVDGLTGPWVTRQLADPPP
jgi:EAL domain-containing protein (putative c-di-GMP-specific phosphodiesterase class I)/GGDEF domain-containing protein